MGQLSVLAAKTEVSARTNVAKLSSARTTLFLSEVPVKGSERLCARGLGAGLVESNKLNCDVRAGAGGESEEGSVLFLRRMLDVDGWCSWEIELCSEVVDVVTTVCVLDKSPLVITSLAVPGAEVAWGDGITALIGLFGGRGCAGGVGSVTVVGNVLKWLSIPSSSVSLSLRPSCRLAQRTAVETHRLLSSGGMVLLRITSLALDAADS